MPWWWKLFSCSVESPPHPLRLCLIPVFPRLCQEVCELRDTDRDIELFDEFHILPLLDEVLPTMDESSLIERLRAAALADLIATSPNVRSPTLRTRV